MEKIKNIISKWKLEIVNNLKENKKMNIEVYFIPKEWDYSTNIINSFNNKISNKEENEINVLPNEDYSIIGKKIFIDNGNHNKDLISKEAFFVKGKLIIDLGKYNYYFYYLNEKNDLCEGYIKSPKFMKADDKKFIDDFKYHSICDFIDKHFKYNKPEIKNNTSIYKLNKFNFVIKKNELINNNTNINNNIKEHNNDDIKQKKDENKKENINNKISPDYKRGNNSQNNINNNINDNKEIKDNNKNEIIKCIIYYFYSELDYIDFKKNEKVEFENGIRKSKNELDFNLINSDWIKLFKHKYNYDSCKNIINNNNIDDKNYLRKLHHFKKFNFDKIEPVSNLKEISIDSMGDTYIIYKDYELINPELYDLFVGCFGKEKKIKENNNLNVVKLDDEYIIVKYNLKMIEIINIKNESERFLIIGKSNLNNNILQDLLNIGFNIWRKDNNLNDKNKYSSEIFDIEGKTLGMFYYLPNVYKQNNNNSENDKEENDKYKKRRIDRITGSKSSTEESESISGIVGLENVGATCYMNASLQCFSNVPNLRIYFLNNKDKLKEKKLSSSLLTVFENLWEKKNISYFAPKKFKEVISEMNPLFKGIQANDSKDLILFILETIHNELNVINNDIIQIDNNINNLDYDSVFNNFSNNFRRNYNSIISNLFYGMYNSMMTCYSCNATVHNVQCFNILIFPLEEVRKFKGYNQNIVNIFDCFDYYQKQDFMTGQNQISCNFCNRMSNSINQTRIILTPNVLIINLNRGKGIMYDIKLNFIEYLELRNYIFYPQSPHYYELVGVVSHLGGSDMSGHFIAFCKNSENAKWYKFNDSIVNETSIQEVLNFGVPYVLFFNYIQC